MNDYTELELIERLKLIKEMGYVKTHRAGNTGVGKTLEDLLEIKENNLSISNGTDTELKSARKNSSSMLTLFTKSPLPQKANSILLKKFGYESSRGNKKKELHTTVNAIKYNQLKGQPGFKVDIKKDRINLMSSQNEIFGYWDKETLKKSFERKLPKLLYVKAETIDKGASEKFWFNEAWLLRGFDFDNFLNLLRESVILIDIRLGQYPNGRPHDHGTAFRVLPDKLELCFEYRERII
jgi:hypothetical protein